MLTKDFTIIDPNGLHARPATHAVKVAASYKSDIKLEFNGRKVDMKSILGVMSLGAKMGDKFFVHADGEDEQEVITNITETLQNESIIE